MQYTYRITAPFKEVLNRWDLLGHDTMKQAAETIIKNETWEIDFDLTEADAQDIEIVRQWRKAVMLNNQVNYGTDSLLNQHFGL